MTYIIERDNVQIPVEAEDIFRAIADWADRQNDLGQLKRVVGDRTGIWAEFEGGNVLVRAEGVRVAA